MKILITGICAFAGESLPGVELFGTGDLSRAGNELNRAALQMRGAPIIHGEMRIATDVGEPAASCRPQPKKQQPQGRRSDYHKP